MSGTDGVSSNPLVVIGHRLVSLRHQDEEVGIPRHRHQHLQDYPGDLRHRGSFSALFLTADVCWAREWSIFVLDEIRVSSNRGVTYMKPRLWTARALSPALPTANSWYHSSMDGVWIDIWNSMLSCGRYPRGFRIVSLCTCETVPGMRSRSPKSIEIRAPIELLHQAEVCLERRPMPELTLIACCNRKFRRECLQFRVSYCCIHWSFTICNVSYGGLNVGLVDYRARVANHRLVARWECCADANILISGIFNGPPYRSSITYL